MSNNGEATITQTTPVKFHPMNDQVLVKLDVKQKSVIERGVVDKPKVLPSGIVIAVGRGTFITGHGFVEPQVKPGDHVAIMTAGEWTNLPLSKEAEEIFISVSESLILGRLEGADEKSPWFEVLGKDDRARIATLT